MGFKATSRCITSKNETTSKPQPVRNQPSTQSNNQMFEKFGDFGQAFKDFRETPNPSKPAPKKEIFNLLDIDDDVKPVKKTENLSNKTPNTIEDFLNMNEQPTPQPQKQIQTSSQNDSNGNSQSSVNLVNLSN